MVNLYELIASKLTLYKFYFGADHYYQVVNPELSEHYDSLISMMINNGYHIPPSQYWGDEDLSMSEEEDMDEDSDEYGDYYDEEDPYGDEYDEEDAYGEEYDEEDEEDADNDEYYSADQ